MSFNDTNTEWLSLIEISGPFLAVPVLKEAFPQGLEQLDANKRKCLRQAYEEWRDALENDDPHFPELHQAWIAEVLARGLELDEDGRGDVLKRSSAIPDELIIDLPEYGVKLAPDAAVIDEQSGKALMLIQTFPINTDLEATSKRDGWATSPAERMVNLCRKTGCRLGLLTNGERWMLVDAPVGAVTTFASWYARLWGQEPVTLQAFVHLLGIRRFFVEESERLPALFDRSLKHQDEVTEALGEQVRRAVEVLIQALDKADLDRERTLLANVSTAEIYEAALTVMMRLVFVLSAEERGLLLLGDERYEAHYALSTLRMQLRADSAEILERRWDAWSRLLALFRAVFGGIEHENLRMPALGGSLFDPDRFPFLEGRDKHSQWHTDPAKPLPIDNRTVLLLLDAIQQFQGRTLSYRALDVEQIGYVYEGLLERTVKRAKDVTLELDSTKNAKTPWVTLTELESARKAGDEKLADLLRERSGSSASRIRNDLAKVVDDVLADKLLTACHADVALRDRVKPYANLLRVDPWGYPLVYPTGSFMVTTGSDRRETGTHYTPKSLTEAIVTETLTPVVYVGPAEGKPREAWQLKSAAELLDLKICDPAMGSGAFLVQVCRWLAERLVEAWSQAESSGKYVTVDGEVRDTVTSEEPLPRDDEERIVSARRLIAERCLYGVDLNPLAVELAKLSIWLVTLAKGRPFGFLDHNFRYGDSLLGIHRLEQLTRVSLNPESDQYQFRLFDLNIKVAVNEVIKLRQLLRATPIRDIHDVEYMVHLDLEARTRLKSVELIANAIISVAMECGGNNRALDTSLRSLAIMVGDYLDGNEKTGEQIASHINKILQVNESEFKPIRPFHWVIEFPEVFLGKVNGFDVVVSNPPFAEGSIISPAFKKFCKSHYAVTTSASADGKAPSTSAKINLGTLFIERDISLLGSCASYGLVAPKPFLRNDRYWRARQFMLSMAFPTFIFNLPVNSFKSASVETCAILGGKGWSYAKNGIQVIDITSPTNIMTIEPDTILNDERFVFRVESTLTDISLLESLKKDKTQLDSYFEIKVGINAGRRDFRDCFIGIKKEELFVPKSHNPSSIDAHWISLPEKFDENIHKPTINGRDFTAFSNIKWGKKFLRYTKDVAYLEEFYVVGTKWSAQLRERLHYDRDIKVVSRQTAKTLIATIDTNRYFPLDTVHVYYPNEHAEENGYDCWVLVGILNSDIMRFFYQTLSQETGKVFPQVHISKLKNLPIPPKINLELREKLSNTVRTIISDGLTEDLELKLNDLVFDIYNTDASNKAYIRKVMKNHSIDN